MGPRWNVVFHKKKCSIRAEELSKIQRRNSRRNSMPRNLITTRLVTQIIVISFLCALPIVSVADVLPPAVGFVTTPCGTTITPVPVTCIDGGGLSFADYSGTEAIARVETLSVQPYSALSAFADFQYSFELIFTGDPAKKFDVLVPLLVTLSVSAETVGNNAGAGAEVRRDKNLLAFACSGTIKCFGNVSSFGGTLTDALFPGIHTIDLLATAFSDAGGKATAIADPFIQIDPSFLASYPEYSLTFGDGAVNIPPSATSEPSSLLLLGTGLLGGIGVIRRKFMNKWRYPQLPKG
jgi:hypothetical protein